ncbi:MAG: TM1812 family CRISPR-associated protein [Planctomycetes bacterium]|nr:TM1812 family CRISPR-associated protein [Planctomycetota bacterium]
MALALPRIRLALAGEVGARSGVSRMNPAFPSDAAAWRESARASPGDTGRSVRLISFVGTGKYEETEYFDPERGPEARGVRTRYVVRALAEMRGASEIVLLVTDKAQREHGAGILAALADGGLPAPRILGISDPSEKDPSALWSDFETLRETLTAADRTIVFDITHGFRSGPFFAAAAIAYVQTVEDQPPKFEVVYGAWQARDMQADRSPILSLTAFLDLLDTTRAMHLFLKTGRASEAAARLAYFGRQQRAGWARAGKSRDEEPVLDRIGKALENFGADYEAVRTGSLLGGSSNGGMGTARRLLELLDQGRHHLSGPMKPFDRLLERVQKEIAPLLTDSLVGAEGTRALVHLARSYQRGGRLLEAFATLREAWTNRYLCTTNSRAVFDREIRDSANARFRQEQKHRSDTISDFRNDLLHAGYRRDAAPPKSLAEGLERGIRELESEETVFWNLSNHPSAQWQESQLGAARKLASRIEDGGFPSVDPSAETASLADRLGDLLQAMPIGTTCAMVQGEAVMTLVLVRELQARGVCCVAATTRRDIEEHDDGSATRRFDFVRFREYPSIHPDKAPSLSDP